MTTAYDVFIAASAQRDLQQIFTCIGADNVIAARRFIGELEEKIYTLAALPMRCALIAENSFFSTDYRHLLHKNYRVIYKISGNAVYVLRIVHASKLLQL